MQSSMIFWKDDRLKMAHRILILVLSNVKPLPRNLISISDPSFAALIKPSKDSRIIAHKQIEIFFVCLHFRERGGRNKER